MGLGLVGLDDFAEWVYLRTNRRSGLQLVQASSSTNQRAGTGAPPLHCIDIAYER